MSQSARNVLILVALVVSAFGLGNVSGFFFSSRLQSPDQPADQQADDASAADDDHLELTKQAYENLGLRMGKVSLRDYWKTVAIPGEVIEIPGKSDVSISAPVVGVVEEVMVRSGQALGPNDQLFKLRITDQDLTTLQTKLLSVLSRQQVIQQEIDRLAPLTESGTVSGRRKRDFEYELSQVLSERATLVQGIRARGLPEESVRSILETRDLASTLILSVPASPAQSADDAATRPVSLNAKTPGDYSVEDLQVHPGKSVRQGDELCSLAYHRELYIRGHAFESDLQNLSEVAKNDWPITAEFGHEHRAGHSRLRSVTDLRLLHVDNHVDRDSQTFRFYMPLQNEVADSLTDDQGRTYRQWQFKPGQLAHIRLPIEKWEQQIVLPLNAIVVDGPNAFVFREHLHPEPEPHSHGPDDHTRAAHNHAHDEVHAFIELESVPVRLLHRDDEFAIVANDGQLVINQRIALNSAYKLRLAMQTQTGGSGQHHGHDH